MTDISDGPVAPGELVLSLRGISKNFGAVSALTDIDLDVHAGEVVALVGDNGAGKSTLVKILAGVHQPSSGTINFRGKQVTMPDPSAALTLGIATVVNVVPLALAALHQAGAVLLFGLAIVLAHALREGAAIAPTAPNGEDQRSPLVPPDDDHGRDPRT